MRRQKRITAEWDDLFVQNENQAYIVLVVKKFNPERDIVWADHKHVPSLYHLRYSRRLRSLFKAIRRAQG